LLSQQKDDCQENATTTTKQMVQVFGTVGIHPTRCADVFAEKSTTTSLLSSSNNEAVGAVIDNWTIKSETQIQEIIQHLINITNCGKQQTGCIVAIGECGLDYARLEFCSKEIQKVGLLAQLHVAQVTGLPLYLHNRESGNDLFDILSEWIDKHQQLQQEEEEENQQQHKNEQHQLRGVVHSFDENIEIANKFLSLGLYIGINGCSLKTNENIETVKQLPLNRLILETDCPWCEIKPTHAGYRYIINSGSSSTTTTTTTATTLYPTMKDKKYNRELGYCVKNRTEPCHVIQVARVVAGVKGVSMDNVVQVCNQNVHDLFGSLNSER
jgi:TatD DNase family protein